MFRGDIRHTGQSNYKGGQTNELKWSYKIETRVTSSPSVGRDGTIYFGSIDGRLYAVNPDGSTKWAFQGRKRDNGLACDWRTGQSTLAPEIKDVRHYPKGNPNGRSLSTALSFPPLLLPAIPLFWLGRQQPLRTITRRRAKMEIYR